MKNFLVLLALAGALSAQLQFPGLAPPELKPDSVVASVDGKDITLADVRKMIDADPRLLQFIQKDPQTAIMSFFVMQHLATEGDKRKLAEQSPLKEQLETQRQISVAGAMVNIERDTFPVPEDLMQAYYDSHRTQYEEAFIKGIYLKFEPAVPAATGTSPEDLAKQAQRAFEASQNKGTRTEAQADALAKDIANQLRNGADFAKLVEQYSDDPASKTNGGDLGAIKPNGTTPEPIRKAVFSLSKGQIADPVKSGSAIYIIRLEEKSLPPLALVRSEIVSNIRQEHLNQYMTDLNTRYKPAVKNTDFFSRAGAILAPKQ